MADKAGKEKSICEVEWYRVLNTIYSTEKAVWEQAAAAESLEKMNDRSSSWGEFQEREWETESLTSPGKDADLYFHERKSL